MSVGRIVADILRLLELECPRDLAAAVAELSLKHIEYGLEEWHVDPFNTVMLSTLRQAVSARGFRWSSRTMAAWKWGLEELTSLLMSSVAVGRPKIEKLNQS